MLSASASSCCANPRKALLFSGVSPKERALLFQFILFSLQAHTETPVLPRRLNEIAFKLFFLGGDADGIRISKCTASSCYLPAVRITEVPLTCFYKLMNFLKS